MQQDLLSTSGIPFEQQNTDSGFLIQTVSPLQVLTEKMLLLHELFQMQDTPSRYLAGASRHLYDIIRLFEKLQKEGVVIDERLFRALRKHRRDWFGRRATVYRTSSFRKLCFIPPRHLLGQLMDDYRTLRKEVLFDYSLNFTELIVRIHQINASLNGMQAPYQLQRGCRGTDTTGPPGEHKRLILPKVAEPQSASYPESGGGR